MAPAWISTKQRAPPASAIVATTSFSACAVHRSVRDSWHRPRIWVQNGRKESTLQAWVTPRYRFSEACHPPRPPASIARRFSTPSGRSTCIPLRWWDEERAASSY